MFKFLRFGRGAKNEPVVESQRETFERLVTELNDALDSLPEKPAVTIDPATGHVAFDLPEQFPDEALALPAPSEEEAKTPDEAAEEALSAAEQPAETPETTESPASKDAPTDKAA